MTYHHRRSTGSCATLLLVALIGVGVCLFASYSRAMSQHVWLQGPETER